MAINAKNAPDWGVLLGVFDSKGFILRIPAVSSCLAQCL
jgi:hypothetical protein